MIFYDEVTGGLVYDRDLLVHYGVGPDDNPPGRGSGRYPAGSGERPHQHDWDIYNRIRKLEAQGLTAKQIAEEMGYSSTTQLKAVKAMSVAGVKADEGAEIAWYMENINPDTGKTFTPTEIGKILGINESSVRTKYATYQKGNFGKAQEAADQLKELLTEKPYLEVGRGTAEQLGISQDRLKTSLAMLKEQGYVVDTLPMTQMTGGGNMTTFTVLAAPGTTRQDIWANRFNIRTVEDFDGVDVAAMLKGNFEPNVIGLNRVKILYDEQGGTLKDGMIEIRAVRDENGNLVAASPDLSLGNAKYAQVRIAVDGGEECITMDNPTGMKYIKGMAVYSENLPEGTDILVNSNKSIKDGPATALKDLKVGETNPFGSTVVQTTYVDPKTGQKKASAINVVGTSTEDMHIEGVWGNWSKNLPSQFLSKQSLGLVTQQLKLKVKQSEDELDDILALNNPVVKQKCLIDYADQCDSDAVSLKAAPIAGQGTKVLLAVKSLKDNECYCPSLDDGTPVAVVRFPHAGPFEIVTATVNNKNKEAQAILKNAKDCIGINSNQAQKLSGADFDGDTGIVIPMARKNAQGEFEKTTVIKATAALEGLKGFDPTGEYSVKNSRFAKQVDKNGKPTYHIMTEEEKGIEMGVVSNLITDMYAKGCTNTDEITRAVKYSMVVIDAKKHKLNYKVAEQDYNIEELKKKYQTTIREDGTVKTGGASSLLSRSKSIKTIPARSTAYKIDPETGEKIYRPAEVKTEQIRSRVKVAAPEGYTYTDKNGKSHKSTYLRDENGKFVYQKDEKGNDIWVNTGKYRKKTIDSTKMAEAKNANELLSDNPNEIERAYADYANHMKALGNKARKLSLSTGSIEKNKAASEKYSEEVKSLKEKLTEARKNAPRERQAQVYSKSLYKAACDSNPDWDDDDKKKCRQQCIKAARKATGAQPHQVKFTESEWKAVNEGAVSTSFLRELLKSADKDNYMELAMPKTSKISAAKQSRIQALYNAGWSYSEIADAVGVSTSSVANYVS